MPQRPQFLFPFQTLQRDARDRTCFKIGKKLAESHGESHRLSIACSDAYDHDYVYCLGTSRALHTLVLLLGLHDALLE